MLAFLKALVHSTDPAADSIVVAGLAFAAALIGFEAWDVVALGHAFSPVPFAAAGVSVLGGIGGAKRLRGTQEN